MDDVYVRLIKDEIKLLTSDCNRLENKNTYWDFVKCKLRTTTILYSISKSKRIKERENLLLKRIDELEKDLSNIQNFNEYNQVKCQSKALEKEKLESIIFRSKIKCVEQGERNTKYFLQTEKRNYNQKHITKLISENQIEISNPQDILEEERHYYKNRYSSKLKPDESIYNQFLDKNSKA